MLTIGGYMRHIPEKPFYSELEFHYNNRNNPDIFGAAIRAC